MRISIDATGLGWPKTGTVVYLTEILHRWNQNPEIKHDFIVFAGASGIRHLGPLGLDERFKVVSAPTPRLIRILWQQIVLPFKIAAEKVDVHWGTGFVLPLLSGKPMLLTVYDLTFQMFPGFHELLKRHYFPAMLKASIRRAGAILTISKATCDDLHRLLPQSRGKTKITTLAARTLEGLCPGRKTRSAPDVSSEYLLFIGTLEPRKNLERLLLAWQQLEAGLRAGKELHVVGATGWMVEKNLRRFRRDTSIKFHGEVEDVELERLLAGALGFVYPSLYEGFGLPVIEAMSLGVPVLTSKVGATKEVAEGAALLVDPKSVEDMHLGMKRLLTEVSLRKKLSTLGISRASQYSWESTAKETLQTIESLLPA